MNQDLVKQIIASGSASLQKLAEVAGSTAIHLYSVLVKQQVIVGAISIIQILVFIAIVAWPLKRLYQWIKDYQEDENIGGGMNWFIGVSAGIIVVVGALIIVNVLGDSVNRILNPEYYAIKVIFETVKR